jgi:hypothetical protein
MVTNAPRFLLCVIAVLNPAPLSADADGPGTAVKFSDRFKAEPDRPKAPEPIPFLSSLEQARAIAKATDRRVLIYFTGPGCGWCRALEARTFTDAEVVDLSKRFVCVRLDTERDSKQADAFRIDSIPRSIVLLPDGTTVDQRVGYFPAADYAAWLKGGLYRSAASDLSKGPPVPPPPAGFPETGADFTIWFVDNDRVVEAWRDPDAFRHPVLLALLSAAGLRPRVEHLSRADFPARWPQAEALRRLPDLIAPTNWAGLVRELDKAGRFRTIQSSRLSFMTENASCQDFSHRFLLLVRGSAHESQARKAVEVLLAPGPEFELPGPPLPASCGRDEALAVARRAAAAYLSGDPAALRPVASRRSGQLVECSRPGPYVKGRKVEPGHVEIRGNQALAVAAVEASFENDRILGGDRAVVVLVSEDGRWKALVVSQDPMTVKGTLPRLCQLVGETSPSAPGPPEPRLLMPLDGRVVNEERPELRWEVAGGGSLLSQVCEKRYGPSDEPATSWPDAALAVFPPEPRSGRLSPGAGIVGGGMSWCVWTIGRDGRVAVSPTAHFTIEKPRVK